MRWPRFSGALWVGAFAGALGTWDATHGKANLAVVLGSGGIVAGMWGAPALVAALLLERRLVDRPLDAARAQVGIAMVGVGTVVLIWLRTPLLARFHDAVLAGFLWSAFALALLGLGVAVGEPLARRLAATRRHLHVPFVSLTLALSLVAWSTWALLAAPPCRGLAAQLQGRRTPSGTHPGAR